MTHDPRAAWTVRAAAPRVLLIEDANFPDADELDAQARLAALVASGANVRAVIVRGRSGEGTSHEDSAEGFEPVARFALPRLVREDQHDLVLLASPHPYGGLLADRLRHRSRVLWMPTGFAASDRWSLPRARIEGVPGTAGRDAGIDGCVLPAIGPARPTLPLWDGAYLLVPTPFEGRAGGEVLAAFASIAEEWSGVDVVVLADPQPAFERVASGRGVGPRVHFVGAAPSGAQRAWWTHAAAVLFGTERPIAGGLVLRGLEARCPMLAASSGSAATLGRWLADYGLAPHRDRGTLTLALADTLRRGWAVSAMVDRGAALARDHDAAALTARFTSVLPGGEVLRKAA
jgi:hypothetical protein